MDVGDRIWGYAPEDGRDLAILDHHFNLENQFPAAATAVLHYADAIWKRLHRYIESGDGIWIVTHERPDFDALASAFLVQEFVTSPSLPSECYPFLLDAVTQFEATRPRPSTLPAMDWWARWPLEPKRGRSRWPMLVAQYAAHVDRGRPMWCPRGRSLHAVLYTAIQRGRPYESADGAYEFFSWIRERLSSTVLNPILDDIWGTDSPFEPELAVLSREEAKYRSDLRRARRSLVTLPRFASTHQFEAALVRETEPFSGVDGQPTPIHSDPGTTERGMVDALYLRDPECMLFKEWAREDFEESSLHQGFTFLAIAYSNERGNARNRSRYIFSLDQERAGGFHLYPLWVVLQQAELAKLAAGVPGGGEARVGYEARAGDDGGLWNDPWFEGPNYRWTIIDTPSRGTDIGPEGSASDLSDDAVVQLVRRRVEYAHFAGGWKIWNLPGKSGEPRGDSPDERLEPNELAHVTVVPDEGFRVVGIALADEVIADDDPHLATCLSRLVGEQLWMALHRGTTNGVPTDFVSRHLIAESDAISVWSRRGIGVAYKASASRRFEQLLKHMAELATAADQWLELLERSRKQDEDAPRIGEHKRYQQRSDFLRDVDRLLVRLTLLRERLVRPNVQALRRFADAYRMDEAISALRSVSASRAEMIQMEAMTENQTKLEYVEIFIVSVYAIELLHVLVELWTKGETEWIPLFVIASVVLMWLAYIVFRPVHKKRLLVLPVLLTLGLFVFWAWLDHEAYLETRRPVQVVTPKPPPPPAYRVQ